MIRILRYLTFFFSWRFIYNNIKKPDYLNIFNNYNVLLRTLNIFDVLRFLTDLTKDNLSENSFLNTISLPFNLEMRNLYDNNYKKLFLFGFGFTIIVYRWLKLLRKFALMPFKLGMFTTLYSILGFDVSWVLNIFNFFPFNIPNWVYVQYITLYNNWLNWWYNTVNIKSITSVPLIEEKKNITKHKKELVEIEKPENYKLWYVAGVVTVVIGVGFALWYFGVFNSSDPGPGNRPGQGGSAGLITTSLTDSNLINSSTGSNVHQIQISDNQTRNTPIEPTSEVNNEWNFRSSTPASVDASSSSASSNPWGGGPPSPTGSTDSSETVRPSGGRPYVLLRRK